MGDLALIESMDWGVYNNKTRDSSKNEWSAENPEMFQIQSESKPSWLITSASAFLAAVLMVNITGPGSSAPFSKSTTFIGPPPGVFSSHFQSGTELMPMTTKSDEKPSSLQEDIDDPMDGMGDDDGDSYGSDFEDMEDPPEYLPFDDESDAAPKPTASYSLHGHSEADPLPVPKCVVCDRPKVLRDALTCGNQICDRKLRFAQGLQPPRTSAGPSPSSRCFVCNKPSDGMVCGSEVCFQKLRNMQGFANNSRPSVTSNGRPGSSSYSAAVQTRGQTRARGQMCAVCHQRPRYSHNGKTYPTCGLRCAAEFNQSESVEMCELCHQRPKVTLNGRTYPHCGRTCRDKARAAADDNGIGAGTCTTCLNCWMAPAEIQKDEFCSDACREIIEHRAPLLLEVPRGHASFNIVESEFKKSWTPRKVPCPTLKKLYMVCIPAKQEANFKDYGRKVTSSYGIPGGFLSKKKEEFRWMPGLRDCPLGHPGLMDPCENPQCQLCNILRGTYLPENFGKGISTMSLPGATQYCDRWAARLDVKTSKIVVLSRVYPGKVVELDRFQAAAGPPHGANSVKLKHTQSYSRVDMDEIVVYSCEALRPMYLISYE